MIPSGNPFPVLPDRRSLESQEQRGWSGGSRRGRHSGPRSWTLPARSPGRRPLRLGTLKFGISPFGTCRCRARSPACVGLPDDRGGREPRAAGISTRCLVAFGRGVSAARPRSGSGRRIPSCCGLKAVMASSDKAVQESLGHSSVGAAAGRGRARGVSASARGRLRGVASTCGRQTEAFRVTTAMEGL